MDYPMNELDKRYPQIGTEKLQLDFYSEISNPGVGEFFFLIVE